MRRGRPFIVAIAGGSASGKTSFARVLREALAAHDATIVAEDSYYLPSAARPPGDLATYNFDRPQTKEFDLLIGHLGAARAGETFHCPRYDFATHERVPEVTPVAPCGVLIVEGLHNLAFEALRAQADLTVFIDAGRALRRARRIARDVAERGRRADETAAQFDAVVEPMHTEHVAPLRGLAQRIVVNAGAIGALESAALELAREIDAALASPVDKGH